MKHIVTIALLFVLCNFTDPVMASKYGRVKIWDGTNTVKVDSDSSLHTAPHNWNVEVAAGRVGAGTTLKFGLNRDVDAASTPEDCWEGGGLYKFFPTSAESLTIRSTSVLDDVDSAGADTIILFGLDSTWMDQRDTVVLNGTSLVGIPNKYIRMNRGIVLTAGDSAKNVGNLIVESVTDNDTAVWITAGDNQTQMTIYTIPANRVGYLIKGYAGIARGGSGRDAEISFKARPNNGTQGVFAIKFYLNLNNSGTGIWDYTYGVPLVIPAKTDLLLRVESVSSNDTGIFSGFDIYLESTE